MLSYGCHAFSCKKLGNNGCVNYGTLNKNNITIPLESVMRGLGAWNKFAGYLILII